MKLEFEIDRRDKFWTVKVFTLENIFEDNDGPFEELLNEVQYQKLGDWCSLVFHVQNQPYRARRMSYDTFWFSSKRDLDWFVLYWSGIDSDSF